MGQYGTLFSGGQLGGSTQGAAGAPVGSTPAMKGADGKLVEYNPNTMATATPEPVNAPTSSFQAAGVDANTGLSSRYTNWLAGGAMGTPPPVVQPASHAATVDPGAATRGAKFIKPTIAIPKTTHGESSTVPKTVNTPTTPAAGGMAPGITQVPGSGLPQGGFQQPLHVNDQWQGGTGTSQPVATPALGANFQPQFSAPIYTDGKGGFFSDAQGKVPVNANVAAQLKNSLGLYGHV